MPLPQRKSALTQSNSLQVTQKQTLTMSAQMQQALQLLTMNILDLETLVDQKLEENPLLEIDPSDLSDSQQITPLTVPDETDDETDSFKENRVNDDNVAAYEDLDSEWSNTFDDGTPTTFSRANGPFTDVSDSADDYDQFEIINVGKDQKESLVEQIDPLELSEDIRQCAIAIIYNLNDHGYFTEDPAEFCRTACSCSEEVFNKALKIVQSLDPAGIGAADLRESLLLQLERKEEKYPLAESILKSTALFDLFVNNKRNELCTELECSSNALGYVYDLVASMTLYPYSAMPGARPITVMPDVIIRKVQGKWEITLTQGRYKNLSINSIYKTMIHEKKLAKRESKFIKDKMNEASVLIENINRRNETLLKVVSLVIKRQNEFFDKGESFMKPLKMSEIAAEIGCHEATVARTVAGKYVDTPMGIFELKHFFSRAVGGNNFGDSGKSGKAIMSVIRELIDAEDKTKPYKDCEIEKILAKRGFKVARRTIAKYRDKLSILPAKLRKIV